MQRDERIQKIVNALRSTPPELGQAYREAKELKLPCPIVSNEFFNYLFENLSNAIHSATSQDYSIFQMAFNLADEAGKKEILKQVFSRTYNFSSDLIKGPLTPPEILLEAFLDDIKKIFFHDPELKKLMFCWYYNQYHRTSDQESLCYSFLRGLDHEGLDLPKEIASLFSSIQLVFQEKINEILGILLNPKLPFLAYLKIGITDNVNISSPELQKIVMEFMRQERDLYTREKLSLSRFPFYHDFIFKKVNDNLLMNGIIRCLKNLSAVNLSLLPENLQEIFNSFHILSGIFSSEFNYVKLANHLYQRLSNSNEHKKLDMPFNSILFCTYVCTDGFGDLVHCMMMAILFKKIFPHIKVRVKAFIDKARIEKAHAIIKDKANQHAIPIDFLNADELMIRNPNRLFPQYLLMDPEFKSKGELKVHLDEIISSPAVIEVSFPIPGLREWLKQNNCTNFFAFFSELGLPLWQKKDLVFYYAELKAFQLFRSPHDLNCLYLRIGSELGFRFDDDAIACKKRIASLSFNERTHLFNDAALGEMLRQTKFHEQTYQPCLVEGYLRTNHNAHRVYKILAKVYADKNIVLNVFVKSLPKQEELQQLIEETGFAMGIIQDQNNEPIQISNPHKITGPILRLILRTVSLVDATLFSVMSQVSAVGGDWAYIRQLTLGLPAEEEMKVESTITTEGPGGTDHKDEQLTQRALPKVTLPFMEKMSHDKTSYYANLLFLIQEYLPESLLLEYYTCKHRLTSLNVQVSGTEAESQLIDKIAHILRTQHDTLGYQFSQFAKIIYENHNMEAAIRQFPEWYNKKVWLPEFLLKPIKSLESDRFFSSQKTNTGAAAAASPERAFRYPDRR